MIRSNVGKTVAPFLFNILEPAWESGEPRRKRMMLVDYYQVP